VPAPLAPEPNNGSTQRVIGAITAGSGLVSVIVGTTFAIRASAAHDQFAAMCVAQNCTANSLALMDEGKSASTISTVFFVAGGTLVATGAILYLTAPSSAPKAVTAASPPLVARVGPSGVTLAGAF
jgi:hypothetical protein